MKIKNTADTSREKILTELTWEEHSMTQQRNAGTFMHFHYETAETIQDDKGKWNERHTRQQRIKLKLEVTGWKQRQRTSWWNQTRTAALGSKVVVSRLSAELNQLHYRAIKLQCSLSAWCAISSRTMLAILTLQHSECGMLVSWFLC